MLLPFGAKGNFPPGRLISGLPLGSPISSYIHFNDIIEEAFTQVCSRFNHYLARLYRNTQHPERGLIRFDKSSTEARVQTLARDFKYSGHQYGRTRNYAEVPVFLDSKASRLIQLADLVAYSIFRHIEFNDSQFFEIIEGCFDAEGGVVHGMYQR